METPRTDEVRFRLHASLPNWPDEARDAIERYDDLARDLERSLAQREAQVERLLRVAEAQAAAVRAALAASKE